MPICLLGVLAYCLWFIVLCKFWILIFCCFHALYLSSWTVSYLFKFCFWGLKSRSIKSSYNQISQSFALYFRLVFLVLFFFNPSLPHCLSYFSIFSSRTYKTFLLIARLLQKIFYLIFIYRTEVKIVGKNNHSTFTQKVSTLMESTTAYSIKVISWQIFFHRTLVMGVNVNRDFVYSMGRKICMS